MFIDERLLINGYKLYDGKYVQGYWLLFRTKIRNNIMTILKKY